MTNFCNHCAINLGLTRPDIDVYALIDEIKTGHHISIDLCEGCGLAAIGKDSDGDVYVLVVGGIASGEGLWIPLQEWEDTLFMTRSINPPNSNFCVDLGNPPDWIKSNK